MTRDERTPGGNFYDTANYSHAVHAEFTLISPDEQFGGGAVVPVKTGQGATGYCSFQSPDGVL